MGIHYNTSSFIGPNLQISSVCRRHLSVSIMWNIGTLMLTVITRRIRTFQVCDVNEFTCPHVTSFMAWLIVKIARDATVAQFKLLPACECSTL